MRAETLSTTAFVVIQVLEADDAEYGERRDWPLETREQRVLDKTGPATLQTARRVDTSVHDNRWT